MSHDTDVACACVATHRPPYLELEEHHVLPIYLGGAKDGETVFICNTTHSSVHEIMRLLLRHGRLTYAQVQALEDRPVARHAYALAVRGFDLYVSSQESA